MQITLKYIAPIIRYLLGIKIFHNHMLFTIYFNKRKTGRTENFLILIFSNWIRVFPVYPKFCIGADKDVREPNILGADEMTPIHKHQNICGRKVTSFSFFIEIFMFINLVCKIYNACIAKLRVTSTIKNRLINL